MNGTVKCFYFWCISCEHQDQCIVPASNTVLLKSKLTVPRIPILATRFSNLATFENQMSQDLRFWPKVTRLRESRADLRNIMSLLLDWSLEVEIHQIDSLWFKGSESTCCRLWQTAFASLSFLRNETKFARLKHVCLFNGQKNSSQNSLLIQSF